MRWEFGQSFGMCPVIMFSKNKSFDTFSWNSLSLINGQSDITLRLRIMDGLKATEPYHVFLTFERNTRNRSNAITIQNNPIDNHRGKKLRGENFLQFKMWRVSSFRFLCALSLLQKSTFSIQFIIHFGHRNAHCSLLWWTTSSFDCCGHRRDTQSFWCIVFYRVRSRSLSQTLFLSFSICGLYSAKAFSYCFHNFLCLKFNLCATCRFFSHSLVCFLLLFCRSILGWFHSFLVQTQWNQNQTQIIYSRIIILFCHN